MQYHLKRPSSIKLRKRIGRGIGSGHGKTSCRGQKGQMSRSGSRRRAWFEGGQMPIQRRVPKRGFTNIFKKNYQNVNLSQLTKLDSDVVNPELLSKVGIIKDAKSLLKVLGDGHVDKPISVIADAFSKSAKEKIEGAGGKVILKKDM